MAGTKARQNTLRAKLQTVTPAAVLAVLMAGCGSNVTLDPPTIPTPLIDKLPLSVGLRMPVEFHHFVHEEEVLGREEWTIDLGTSNAALFTQLFEHMFAELTVLAAEDDPGTLGLDALIEPSIDAFEFSVPNQSKTDTFAVWIRYRIKVYDRDGTIVANWPVSAYGKSQTTTMGGSDALQRAAVLAMRDAAALMIMKLDQQTGISSLIEQPPAEPPVIPSTAPLDSNEDEVQTTALEGNNDDATQH